MASLRQLARLIRSKNAGPFVLTFDVMFDDSESYRRVREANRITPALFAAVYHVDPRNVRIYFVDSALAIKISIPRPCIQGDLEDADSHGCQQFGPLVHLEVP